MEPGEIAFRIHTNGNVTTDNFARFLSQFTQGPVAALFPPFDIEIDRISKGSIFALLRVVFRNALTTEDEDRIRQIAEKAIQRHEQANDALGTDVDLRRAVEGLSPKLDLLIEEQRAARRDAWERDRNRDRSGNKAFRVAAAGLTIAALALVNDFAGNAKSVDPDPPATVVADMMQFNGVSGIDLWCDGDHIWLNRSNIPHYQHQAIAAVLHADTGTVTAKGSDAQLSRNFILDDATLDGGSDDSPALGAFDPGIFNPTVFNTGDRPKRAINLGDAASPHGGDWAAVPEHASDWITVQLRGTVRYRGKVPFFFPEGAPDDRALLLVTNNEIKVPDGEELQIIGEAFIGKGHDVLVARIATAIDDLTD
ncbi:hypothetical protein ASD67_00110 [Sphingopyxis sp. Root1497]|nr:hypothetical protein ASD67_00110 [Sphingopyxis sp. Root1497]